VCMCVCARERAATNEWSAHSEQLRSQAATRIAG
jgi:hypothetical protein